MPESTPPPSLFKQGQSGLVMREASEALRIWVWGPEASLDEASAIPGSPPGLLFDFHLLLHFHLILHYQRLFQKCRSNKRQGECPKKHLSCLLKARNLQFPAPSCRSTFPELISRTITAQTFCSLIFAQQPAPVAGKHPQR